jgi:hypothetical protein
MRSSTVTLLSSACAAALLAASALAGEPGGEAAPTPPIVAPAETTVLPNAPKVGDTAPSQVGPKSGEAEGSPDWPCIQRKVSTITPLQIWDGPPIDGLTGWENDEKIVDLTAFIESRRVPIEEAEKAIKEYAASLPEAERDQKLTLLFASLLDRINTDRRFVIGRVEEFQRRQKARAEELEREGQKLAELNQAIPPDEQLGTQATNLTPEQHEYNWNARIFAERQQNLTMACEIPVLIEQRAYEVAQIIRQQMKQ